MNTEIIKQYETLKDEIIDKIGKLVSIPSVIDESTNNLNTSHPFGVEIEKALDETLELCKDLGFKTFKDSEGYYGYAEIGEGKEMIAVLGHLDVVPAGNLEMWNSDPFKAILKDNKLYGRGTQDDKGPTVIALYAAKALMNLKNKFNKRVRFIFGTDEENLWRCINKYMQNEEVPSMGFTPDSKFPMIYAEKGLLQFNLIGKGEDIEINVDSAYNAVPDKAQYSGKNLDSLVAALDKLNYTYEIKDNEVTVLGKSVHAAAGEDGINAIKHLVIALKETGYSSPSIDFIANEIGNDPYAEKIFGVVEDEDSGKLKFNVGKLIITKDKSQIGIDIRIPVTANKDIIVETIKTVSKKYGFEYEERDFLRSLYVPKDHILIKTLRKIYEEETGFDSTPISSGGATYARSMDNCVAFGMVFPDGEKTEHQPNEYISLKDMERAFGIYAKAIQELSK
ncbi:Sapep family Mn(2+)-dependent dipeptidase [Cetobacterium sp. 2A]|uniref:M20 family metallopeptidase n=1 Tax=Cetobacterium sp. 2A TaxID=2754723 RepID=UPI00163CA236|nr:M20 family metallopeptidase [Cetobacterium sp. 2A]MBC2855556.1 Sapep family Mn(2+)-dependent dipeptidase [Cetobacterium sp. 2A]